MAPGRLRHRLCVGGPIDRCRWITRAMSGRRLSVDASLLVTRLGRAPRCDRSSVGELIVAILGPLNPALARREFILRRSKRDIRPHLPSGASCALVLVAETGPLRRRGIQPLKRMCPCVACARRVICSCHKVLPAPLSGFARKEERQT